MTEQSSLKPSNSKSSRLTNYLLSEDHKSINEAEEIDLNLAHATSKVEVSFQVRNSKVHQSEFANFARQSRISSGKHMSSSS